MKWYENVVHVCMGVQPGERVLLITDAALQAEQDALAETIRAVGPAELLRWTLPEADRPLTTAPDHILAAARTFDVGIQFLGSTSTPEQPYRFSLVKATSDGGVMRFGVGLYIDDAIFANELSADYERIAEITHALHSELDGRDAVHVTSPLGTDLRLSIAGRQIAVDPGQIRAPGYYNLPAGECYVAPIETSANGILVVDKSFPDILIHEPIRLTFEQGRVVRIEGGAEAEQLRAVIADAETKPHGEGSRTIAELGIGTNPQARITGSVMTDEKVMGTIHIAIGHNAVPPYNGQNVAPIHLDGVMGEPTLVVDGKTLIDRGDYLIAP
jgi:leucyl aminopeptidase (aminopeptidase T)